MTFEEFVKKYKGKTVGYPKGSYVGQCLSLVKWYIKECFGINPPASGVNAAYGYWTNFPDPLGTVLKKVPNTPELVPERGWIAVWNKNVGGGYGHIATVLDADVKKFTSLDQNWGGKHAHEVAHDYKNVYGFLAPVGNETEQIRKELEELRIKYASLEATIPEKNEAIKQLTENEKKWQAEAKSANDNLEKVLEEKGELEKTIASLERKVDKLEKELKEMEKEKNNNWQLYKKALKTQADKQTSLQLITILFNRLYNKMKSLFVKKSVDSSNTK